MLNSCYIGHCFDGLQAFAAAGIRAQTCVTSPPYWGLRDYGVDGQIGLEATVHDYIVTMMAVFRAVRDVLADDGTLWLNLGDSYVASGSGEQGKTGQRANRRHTQRTLRTGKSGNKGNAAADFDGPHRRDGGLPPKNLIGVPWRVAFALQADGWYLRSDIIWHKPNPMPESVTDRPTKAHEYLFLLAKSERYYYDAAAISEPAEKPVGSNGNFGNKDAKARGIESLTGNMRPGVEYRTKETRNKRSVWSVVTQPFDGAHFAVFPRALIEPCILAGSRVGDVVLDPFMGSGTTAQVAEHLGRQWIGCELNPEYLELQRERLRQQAMTL